MKIASLKNLLTAALAGLLFGTVGETLLFLEAQSRRVEQVLLDDFRVLVFLDQEQPEAKRRAIEDGLRGVGGTAEVRYVSRDAALEELRSREPELGESVALLGDNPLSSGFEVVLEPDSVARVGAWADAAARVPGVGDIRFKPLQVQAIVQCQFYSRFLRLAVSLASFFWLAGAAAVLWAALNYREARPALEALGPRLALAGCGTAIGMGLVLVAAVPLKSAPAGWAAPPGWAQASLWLAGSLAALFAWDWHRLARPEGAPHGRAEARSA